MRRNAKARRREEALRDAMVLHDLALQRDGVAQRRKDPQRDGIATLWNSVDVISYGMEPQCFAMICKGEDKRRVAKTSYGTEKRRTARGEHRLEPQWFGTETN